MSSSFQVWQTILTVLVWASMVGEGGEKIPPFSTRVKPPLEASEEQIKEALRARANYSTPFRVACAAGMASLTYIGIVLVAFKPTNGLKVLLRDRFSSRNWWFCCF